MGRYKVSSGQNIYDVAMHLYGSIEGIVDLMMNNGDLSLDTVLASGQELVYTDDFVINADVVAYNETHGIVPANGERHVYPKTFTKPQAVIISLNPATINVKCLVSGNGMLEIDWGDNSDTERVTLTDNARELTHTFDNKVRGKRKIRWFTDAAFRQIDWSGLYPDPVILLQPLRVEELTIKDSTSSLDSLQLLRDTCMLDLAGSAIADLTPITGCRNLMTLNLADAGIKPTVIDGFLTGIAREYGNRRNCTVTLPVAPTGSYREPQRDGQTGRYILTSGMEAVWVILHEEAWNEGGTWKFIINDITYTVE